MKLARLICLLRTHEHCFGDVEVLIQAGEYGVVEPLQIDDVDFGQDADGVGLVRIEAKQTYD